MLPLQALCEECEVGAISVPSVLDSFVLTIESSGSMPAKGLGGEGIRGDQVEGGRLKGVFMASRLSGLSPNLTSRFYSWHAHLLLRCLRGSEERRSRALQEKGR